MTWNYSGDPASCDRDHVRFLIGDTCSKDPLIQDEEIAFAVASQTSITLAAAICLRSLAARYSRLASHSVGEVSKNCSDLAKAFAERAKEFDPTGQATIQPLAKPSFGGLTISGKQALKDDTDAVQPSFEKGLGDYPGSFDDSSLWNPDPDWRR